MKAILSYHPSYGPQLLTLKDRVEVLRTDSWLVKLISKKYESKPITFLGRDDLKRVEIEMDVNLFKQLQQDPLFVMEADKLRRLRTTRVDFLDFLLTSDVNLIDNDLDKIVEYGNK